MPQPPTKKLNKTMKKERENEEKWPYPEILHPFWLLPILFGIVSLLLYIIEKLNQ